MKINRILISIILITLLLKITFAQNLVLNGDFESSTNNQPDSWITTAWNYQGAAFTYETANGYGNSNCVSITVDTLQLNDARYTQVINNLDPSKWYNLKGMIKGENLITANNITANICIMGTWNHSVNVSGTFDWTEFNLEFQPDNSGSVTIGCRLGFWGSNGGGKAWFDNIEITEIEIIESEYFQLILEESDLIAIEDTNMQRWLDHLDSAYVSYHDLTGFYPYNGDKMVIKSVDQSPGGWAVAGNPIRWHQVWVYDELERINNNDDWSFGILHEVGHNYDDNSWNNKPEFWANFKMYYVLETRNAKVFQGGSYNIGSEAAIFYQGRYNDEKAEFNQTGDLEGYNGCLVHRFIEIKNVIGWEPFKATFRELYDIPDSLVSPVHLDRYFMFLDKLTQHSGINVYDLIPQDDMNEFIAFIGGGIVNQIPEVYIGNDTTIHRDQVLSLSASISDDAYPNPVPEIQWVDINNTGSVTFSQEFEANTEVSFLATGTYTLTLNVYDGQSTGADTINITVIPPLSINNEELLLDICTYPNPSTGLVFFDHTKPGILTIFDITGKEIKRKELNNMHYQIDLTKGKCGIYLYSFKTSDEEIKYGRIVLSR